MQIPELFDTVFIILKKKPLIFLHWYHHVTVLLYCWNSYVTESGAGIYFAAMNYAVHAVMYTYYFLQAVRVLPRYGRRFPLLMCVFPLFRGPLPDNPLFFASPRRVSRRWFPSWIITVLQIAQMLVGTVVVAACAYYHVYGGRLYGPGECHNQPSNVAMGAVIYSSYLYLFVEYAVKRFVLGIDMEMGKPQKTAAAAAAGKAKLAAAATGAAGAAIQQGAEPSAGPRTRRKAAAKTD